MDLNAAFDKRLAAHIDIARQMDSLKDTIVAAVELVINTFKSGNKLLLAGNGGSAADAQHWAAEWVIRLSHDLDRPSMPAMALSTDTSILTAGANDIGYENVFARQVESFGRKGDLLIVISTSGNSTNLLKAVEMAQTFGVKVLGILGNTGGKLAPLCDQAVIIPSDDTQRIQEMHSFVGHLLCELSERELHG
ncbi:SIS domain-containing protein [bacterium]|nr:SIS domain-containing protein [bacterium]